MAASHADSNDRKVARDREFQVQPPPTAIAAMLSVIARWRGAAKDRQRPFAALRRRPSLLTPTDVRAGAHTNAIGPLQAPVAAVKRPVLVHLDPRPCKNAEPT